MDGEHIPMKEKNRLKRKIKRFTAYRNINMFILISSQMGINSICPNGHKSELLGQCDYKPPKQKVTILFNSNNILR